MLRLRLLPALALLLLTGLGGCTVYPTTGYYAPPAVVATPAPRYYYGPGYYRPYYRPYGYRPYGYWRRW